VSSAVILLLLALQAPPPAEPDPEPEPVAIAAPPPAAPRYGDRGTSEIAIGLGYSARAGFLGGGGFRYFVFDRVAPGFEGTYISGGTQGTETGLLLGALRLVPIRTESFALVVTGRAGRVFLADHADGWGAGGAAGILVMLSQGAWVEIGYEVLQLMPQTFCEDLSRCVLHGPVLGIRLIL
jgi:hypothetical protein